MKNIYHNFYRKIIFNASALMHKLYQFYAPKISNLRIENP